jgi:hypothetical protein
MQHPRLYEVGTTTFTAALLKHGSWGHHDLGQHPSTMTLYLSDDRSKGMIEWDIPAIDEVEHIGLWFQDGDLTDYDGTMALPPQAVAMLRSYGFTVGPDFE